ncbi:MAG: hypothetical protein HKN44_07850 [Ilumatobacter sp.]|nr:hypothetical protein [Ilumatobacter sp.]
MDPEVSSDDIDDPRLHHPCGDEGMPGELVDTPANMPGDQPLDDDPPTVSEVHGRDTDD